VSRNLRRLDRSGIVPVVSMAENWDWSLRVFDHVDLRAADYAASVRFYETVLAPLGIPKLAQHSGATCCTNLNAVDRRPPTRNLHLCFHASSRDQVDAFYHADSIRTATTSKRSTETSATSAMAQLLNCTELSGPLADRSAC
jgi:hypothetical protein